MSLMSHFKKSSNLLSVKKKMPKLFIVPPLRFPNTRGYPPFFRDGGQEEEKHQKLLEALPDPSTLPENPENHSGPENQ